MDLLITVEGFVGCCNRGGRGWLCEPDSQLSHTSHTCRLHCSVPRSPLMWPCRPRDKWAQTWKTLRLAKNNKLSTDLLSRNANTKCSLCCNYIHFDRNSRRDSFLYSSVNARFVGSSMCRDILWHQVAVLTLRRLSRVAVWDLRTWRSFLKQTIRS